MLKCVMERTKVFLCGAYIQQPPDEVREKFARAEQQVRSIDYEPVNPVNNGLPPTATFTQHLLANTALLCDCGAIYLMTDWESAQCSRIERYIAQEMGFEVLEQPEYMGAYEHAHH